MDALDDAEASEMSANSIVSKLDASLALLSGGMVFNVLVREGREIEVETTIDGETRIMTVSQFHEEVHLEQVQLRSDGTPQPLIETQNLKNTVGVAVTRGEMRQLANMVSPNWEKEIKKGGVNGEVPEIRANKKGSMRANVYLFGGRNELDANKKPDGLTGEIGATIRIVMGEALELKTLGLSNDIVSLADESRGLLLIVGPVGVGKTTTAISYLEHINKTRATHVVTAENPIEFYFKEKKSRFSQREIGHNVDSIERMFEDMIRNNSNVAFIGELRNAADKQAAFAGAQRGSMVVATGFANNAVDAIRALVNDLPGRPEAEAIAVSRTLLGIIYQVKIPSLHTGAWMFAHECINLRAGSDKLQELIAQSKWDELQTMMDENGQGMQSLNKVLAGHVNRGDISAAAATRNTYDRSGLARLIKSTP